MAMTESELQGKLIHFISYTRSKYKLYETAELQVPTRDIERFVFPKDCTSFELFDRITRVNEQGGADFVGEVVNRSQYYIGLSFNLPALRLVLGEKSPIYREMEAEGAKKIVRVYGDEFLNIHSEDRVLHPNTLKFGKTFSVLPAQTKSQETDASMER